MISGHRNSPYCFGKPLDFDTRERSWATVIVFSKPIKLLNRSVAAYMKKNSQWCQKEEMNELCSKPKVTSIKKGIRVLRINGLILNLELNPKSLKSKKALGFHVIGVAWIWTP